MIAPMQQPNRILHTLGLLKWVVLALLLVMLIGAAGYMYIEAVPFIDALYMTVTTITTVGFGDKYPLTTGGRVFTMALIFAGFGVIMLAVGVLTQMAVEGTFRRVMERRRVQNQIDKFKRHFVLCGCGRIGRHVLTALQEIGEKVVVIESDAETVENLTLEGVPALHGSGAEEDMLNRANLAAARGLIVTVGTDAEAVFIILTARDLNPDLFIVARALEERNDEKLRRAGANRVVSPYRVIGKRMASFITHPAVIDMIDSVMFTGELDLGIEGIVVYSGSPLAGKTLRDSGIRESLGLMIIGVRKVHGNTLFNPHAEEVIEPGDTLLTIGDKDSLAKLAKLVGGK
jgi:voltage-gated potassium channel